MYNNKITFTNTRDKKIIVNHVAKYKEIASMGSRKYKKVRVGGVNGSKDGAMEMEWIGL